VHILEAGLKNGISTKMCQAIKNIILSSLFILSCSKDRFLPPEQNYFSCRTHTLKFKLVLNIPQSLIDYWPMEKSTT